MDLDFTKFFGVKVDGVLIGNDRYTAEAGSTIVTLNADYMKTLTNGGHTVEIVFTDGGVASTTFTVFAESGGSDSLSPGALVCIVIASIV